MAPNILFHCETRHDVGLGQPQPQADNMLLLTTCLKHEYKSMLCGLQKPSRFAPLICTPGLPPKFAPQICAHNLPCDDAGTRSRPHHEKGSSDPLSQGETTRHRLGEYFCKLFTWSPAPGICLHVPVINMAGCANDLIVLALYPALRLLPLLAAVLRKSVPECLHHARCCSDRLCQPPCETRDCLHNGDCRQSEVHPSHRQKPLPTRHCSQTQ